MNLTFKCELKLLALLHICSCSCSCSAILRVFSLLYAFLRFSKFLDFQTFLTFARSYSLKSFKHFDLESSHPKLSPCGMLVMSRQLALGRFFQTDLNFTNFVKIIYWIRIWKNLNQASKLPAW